MARRRYDLAVIGSGPAGQKAALTAAKLGRRVAIIDRESDVGGVCIHTGTIPSKAIREAALHLTALSQRGLYGDGYSVKQDITMSDLLTRARFVVKSEVEVIRSQMARAGVQVVYGTARFEGPNEVLVSRGSEYVTLEAGKIMVACGTEPARPPGVPFAHNRVVDSNTILSMTRLPRSMLVVGGGVIGAEYASVMAAVGVRVTLVDARPRLLEFLDDEIAEALQFRLREMGVRLRLGETVANVGFADDQVVARLASGKVMAAETLLHAIGRQGATGGLNLEAAGVKCDERGRLHVNDSFQTEVPHIYAAGDVIGFPALAATSMEQGRRAAAHMFGSMVEFSTGEPGPFPYGIYTIPEVSTVGQTEAALTAAKVPYEVGVARYKEIARGQLLGDVEGMLKLIFHSESHRLLGVHALGTGATELIHIGQAVMTAGMSIEYFVETVFNYPTLAECYKVAAADGLSRVIQKSTHTEAVTDKAA